MTLLSCRVEDTALYSRLCPMEVAELGLAKVRGRVQNVSGLLRSPMNYDDDSVSHEQRAGRGWTVVRVLGGPLGCPGDGTRAVGSISGHGSWPGCRGASTGSPLVVKRGQFYPRAPEQALWLAAWEAQWAWLLCPSRRTTWSPPTPQHLPEAGPRGC